MSNPYRDCLAELVQKWDAANSDHDLLGVADAMDAARIMLAQPEPPKLTDEDLISAHDLAAEWNQQADADDQWDSLDLYEQLAWAQSRAIAADRARWA